MRWCENEAVLLGAASCGIAAAESMTTVEYLEAAYSRVTTGVTTTATTKQG